MRAPAQAASRIAPNRLDARSVILEGLALGHLMEIKMPTEEHKVSGKNLLDRVKQLVREGNVRHITIKNAAAYPIDANCRNTERELKKPVNIAASDRF